MNKGDVVLITKEFILFDETMVDVEGVVEVCEDGYCVVNVFNVWMGFYEEDLKIMRDLTDLTKILPERISKEWVIHTEAKITKVALYVLQGKLQVATVYWKGKDGGVWEDENLASMCILVDLVT